MKDRVRTLVKTKQLEFNTGGWCMGDEASPTSSAQINQMARGMAFILQEFGPAARPTVGWDIDPFGHGAGTASMWAEMGFDAFGLSRIDYREKDKRKQDKTLEFIWRGSKTLGDKTQIFAHILDSGYTTPHEMSYDSSDQTTLDINTDPALPTYPVNKVARAEAFVNYARQRSAWYRHNKLLIPFGGDFHHTNAIQSFGGMDKLVKYVNANSTYNMTLRYGGFADYVKAVNSLQIPFPVLDQAHPLEANGNIDFFPYSTGPEQYW
jgi:hypothetical protein